MSRFNVRGRVRVIAVPGGRLTGDALETALRTGEARVLVEHKNLLTDHFLEAVPALIGGAENTPTVNGTAYQQGSSNPPSDLFVTEMKIGDANSPSEPAAGDTGLSGATKVSFDIASGSLSVSYPQTGEVRFIGNVDPTEENGTTFTEQGIFTDDGTLMARVLLAKAPTGTIAFASGANVSSGDSVTIHDGSNANVFEFGTNVTVGANATASRDNLISAINGSTLGITATTASATEPKIDLTNDTRAARGNQTIQTNTSTLTVTGMDGGRDAPTKQSAFGLQFEHAVLIERG